MKRLAETELLCIHIVFDSSALVPCFPKRSRYFTNARTTGVCFPPACRAFWRSTGYIAKPTLFSPPSLLGTGSRSTRTQEDRRNYLSAADKASDHSFRAHGNVSVVSFFALYVAPSSTLTAGPWRALNGSTRPGGNRQFRARAVV